MNEIGLILVMVVYSVFDQLRDSRNNSRNKRPHSHLPWPIIDKWHGIKKVQLYLLPVFMVFTVDVSWWAWAVAIVLSAVAWKSLPVPSHWR